MILYEDNKDIVKRVLLDKFGEAPSIEVINENHGSLINEVAIAKKRGNREEIKEGIVAKKDESKTKLGLNMKPTKLPKNNEKC